MNIQLIAIPLNADKTKPEYASENCQQVLQMWESFYPQIGFNLPWVGYFIYVDNEIAGSCAFTGAPSENRVEVSYWTFTQHEGKGIATHACRKLIEIAKKADASLTIIAKTAPEKNPSTTILEKCGFVYSRVVQDHEIGDAWEWELKG